MTVITVISAITAIIGIHETYVMSNTAAYHLRVQTALEEVIEDIDDDYFMDVISESDTYQHYLEVRGY